jgi:hypothetical protein
MKVLSKLTLVFVFGIVGLFGQAPNTAWTRTYGGENYDEGYSVQQTTDGGYIIAGYTESYGVGSDVYLIKTDSTGDALWTKTYGGADTDYGYSVQQTSDGGYIVAGMTYFYSLGYADVYLIKTNSTGDALWTKTYGGAGSDKGKSVQQTTDGGYIVAGETSSYGAGEYDYDVYLIKTNASGDTLWTRTYGGENYDKGESVQQTTDGGYIVAGMTYFYDAGWYDVYLIKTNSLGDTLWTRTYGGADVDCGYSVQQTTDGGYIVTGETHSYGAGAEDVYLIKTNASGDTLWTRTYGGAHYDAGNSVQQTTDGGYIVAGYTLSYGEGADVYLIKTNGSGDTLWTKTYGGSSTDWGESVQQTSDGGYVVAGRTISYGAGNYDVYLIKIKPEGSGIEEEITTGLFSLSPAEPNPFTTKTTIRYELGKAADVDVSVYNMLGQKVRDLYSGKQASGVHSVSWDGGGDSGEKLSSGIYLLKIEAEGEEASTKVMFVR